MSYGRMDKRRVTFLLHCNMSAFVDRALRNETLRAQLASAALLEVPGWLDEAETDELAGRLNPDIMEQVAIMLRGALNL
jgi:hypothetical protein